LSNLFLRFFEKIKPWKTGRKGCRKKTRPFDPTPPRRPTDGGRKVQKNLIFFIFSIAIQGRVCYNEGKRENRWMQDKKFS
jgi:hypothetical protein